MDMRCVVLVALLGLSGCTFITGVPMEPPDLCLSSPIAAPAPHGTVVTVHLMEPCKTL